MDFIKKKSSIHGQGIFTSKNIKKGETFYEIPLKIISNRPNKRWAKIGKGKWVSDERVLNFVNHSCEANTLLDTTDTPRLIALRDIPANEEITVDYNKTETEGTKFFCRCKSKVCRGFFLIEN